MRWEDHVHGDAGPAEAFEVGLDLGIIGGEIGLEGHDAQPLHRHADGGGVQHELLVGHADLAPFCRIVDKDRVTGLDRLPGVPTIIAYPGDLPAGPVLDAVHAPHAQRCLGGRQLRNGVNDPEAHDPPADHEEDDHRIGAEFSGP